MNFFDYFGCDEPSLTRSLGAIFSKDTNFFKRYIKRVCGITLNKEELKTLDISVESPEKDSRYDVKCITKNYSFIIEAKKDRNTVSQEQVDKYMTHLAKSSSIYKYIITLTEIDQMELKPKTGINICYSTWTDIYDILGKNQLTVDIKKEYKSYLEDNLMEMYDIDIWAVKVSGNQKDNFKKGYYLNRNSHRPVMIGYRDYSKDEGRVVVKDLYPVINIIKPDDKDWMNYVKTNGIFLKKGWEENHPYIYIMGAKLSLEKPLDKNFNHINNSFINIKFSDL